MRDRWDEEDELNRDPLGPRGGAREPEQTLGEVIDNAVRRVVTGLAIAGGLIAIGLYVSRPDGGDPSVDYQITSTPDGTIYRLDSEDGRIVACRGQTCWRLLYDSDDIQRGPPGQNAAAAAPQPVQSQPQSQAVAAQPAQAQLPPPPQNQAAPATR